MDPQHHTSVEEANVVLTQRQGGVSTLSSTRISSLAQSEQLADEAMPGHAETACLVALHEGPALSNLKATINHLNPLVEHSQSIAATQLSQKAGPAATAGSAAAITAEAAAGSATSASNRHSSPRVLSQPANLVHSGSFHLRSGSAHIFSIGAIAAEHTLKTDTDDRYNSKSALTISLDRHGRQTISSRSAPSASRVAFPADSRPTTASSYTGMQPMRAALNAPSNSAVASHAELHHDSLTIAPTAMSMNAAATPALHRPMTANPAATEALQRARVSSDTGSSSNAADAALPDQAHAAALQIEPSLAAGSSSSSSSAWSLSDPIGQIPTASVPTGFAAMPEGHRMLSQQTDFDSARWSTQQGGRANLPAQHDDLLFEFEVAVDEEQALPASQPESEVSFSALLPSAGGEDSGIKFWDNGVQAPEMPLSPTLTPSAPQVYTQTATVQAHPLVQLYGSQSIKSTVGFDAGTAANSDSLQLCREVKIKALCHPSHVLQGPWHGYHDVLLSKQWDRSVVTGNGKTFEDRYPTFMWNRLEGKRSPRMVYPPSLQETQTAGSQGAGNGHADMPDRAALSHANSGNSSSQVRANPAGTTDGGQETEFFVDSTNLSLQAWAQRPCPSSSTQTERQPVPASRTTLEGASGSTQGAGTANSSSGSSPSGNDPPVKPNLQRLKKRRTCKARLQTCQPARHWWQLFTG